jgi:hypothetical protein
VKKLLVLIILILVIIGGFYFFNQQKAVTPAVIAPVTITPTTPVVTNNTSSELCFAKFGTPDSNGNYDIDTLRMDLNGTGVKGELNLLPAETDSSTGEIEGTVGAVDNATMARTADLKWYNQGSDVGESLKIIFSESTANIVSYNLNLSSIPCLDFIKRTNVINYLQDNISTLSPVKATAGDTWGVDSETVDLVNNSGTVIYDDGQTQETKNFTYTTDAKGAVTSMKLVDPPNTTACTQEAKICPDGSTVGRTGLNCAFAPCP